MTTRLVKLKSGPSMSAGMLLLFLAVFWPTPSTAQERSTVSSPQDEMFSESLVRRSRRVDPPRPAEVLRSARYIYVRSLSMLVSAEDIENKLRRHPDFERYGMVITRQEADADLILEVNRSVLTKFVFVAIESETLIVVASGKLSSLGGTVDGKVAKLFMKQVKSAREETVR